MGQLEEPKIQGKLEDVWIAVHIRTSPISRDIAYYKKALTANLQGFLTFKIDENIRIA